MTYNAIFVEIYVIITYSEYLIPRNNPVIISQIFISYRNNHLLGDDSSTSIAIAFIYVLHYIQL